jgi:Na+(H+)/acetate symporter ActP
MTPQMIQQIKNNPKYQELVSKRSRFAWTLSVVMLVVYYAFIMILAFSPELLGQTIGYQTAIFPYKYPALFSVSVAFLSIYFISITDNTAGGFVPTKFAYAIIS